MVYEFAGLVALLTVLITYSKLRSSKKKLKQNQVLEQTTEFGNINKQLQANNFWTQFLLKLIIDYKQTETRLKIVAAENESSKQSCQELKQHSATLKIEFDKAKEASARLELNNTLLEQKIEQLESHKQALVQELTGSINEQNIEFVTWEFVIEQVKENFNYLNQLVFHNNFLAQVNEDLEKKHLI
jgi:hypothetical protein